jgi:hypothetical protein
MNKQRRSPLKAKPLRVAGQSLDSEINEFFDDHIAQPGLVVTVLWIVAALEWSRYYFHQPPNPLFFTLTAGGVTVYVAWRLTHMFRKYKALKLGRDGERAVGEFLEHLREQGHHVFHDIVGDKFNIDHVVIGSKGVFVVETKTFSKPQRGEANVSFDGQKLLVDGVKPDRDPIIQARALASWLRDVLVESTGRKVTVRPIVTFPGWYVNPLPKGVRSDVWVLNTKAIPAFVENEPNALTPEDVKLLSFHLSRYVRGKNA